MHETAYVSALFFASHYGGAGKRVIDIGGFDSLRQIFVEREMEYISVDMESMDKPLPFETGSVDLVISTYCFEHDPLFWITFREMARIVKPSGFIYISTPSNGNPDNADAVQVYQMGNEEVYPTKVVETFHILPKGSDWIDFVCVWKRVENETEICTQQEMIDSVLPLEQSLNINNYPTVKRL